jgi:tRNA (Thr-GGU) A37 N-methylase
MLPLKKVALFKRIEGSTDIVVSIEQPLNKVSLRGIMEWSHIWLIYVKDTQIQCTVCKIVSSAENSLVVSPITEIPEGVKIVDLKPYHPLESVDK